MLAVTAVAFLLVVWVATKELFSFSDEPKSPKGRKDGEIAAKAVVRLLFTTGKSFTIDGLREKLRGSFREEVRAELRAVAALKTWS
jgi:hypothetical protein